MSNYFKTAQQALDGLNQRDVENFYNKGFILTRLENMNQTRSLRIDLSKFDLTSENRRVLRKNDELDILALALPLPVNQSNWNIQLLGKNFYEKKFQDVEFSANKIRSLLLQKEISQEIYFNKLLTFYRNNTIPNGINAENIDHSLAWGYCICYSTANILHYCYPFYNLDLGLSNLGLGMMLKAILWAQENGKKFVYLGSFTRPSDTYKLQFKGLEWWDGEQWKNDLAALKLLKF